MKLVDKIQVSKSRTGLYHPQALLHSHSRMQEQIKISRGIVFHRGWLDPMQVVENGEMAVSLLQVATKGIRQIQDHLRKIESDLLEELNYVEEKTFPNLDLKERVERILAKIELLAKETSFKGQCLLDGKLGVTGKGNVTRILGGIPVSREIKSEPIRIEVLKMATRSVLTGHEILTDATIRQESQIILSENDNIAKYVISPNETVESFLQGLQELVMRKGLDLEIQTDGYGHLQILHSQYGSPFVFSGRSQNTAIVSKRPNALQFCHLGENCVGKIEGHYVKTRGHLLFSEKDLVGVRDLTVLWESKEPGMDHLMVNNRAILVSGGSIIPQSELWIALASCDPIALANGVQNRSGFTALSQAVPETWLSIYDTLYLVQLSLTELEERIRILETTQKEFEQGAMLALEFSNQPQQEHFLEEVTSEHVTQMASMLQKAFGP